MPGNSSRVISRLCLPWAIAEFRSLSTGRASRHGSISPRSCHTQWTSSESEKHHQTAGNQPKGHVHWGTLICRFEHFGISTCDLYHGLPTRHDTSEDLYSKSETVLGREFPVCIDKNGDVSHRSGSVRGSLLAFAYSPPALYDLHRCCSSQEVL